MSRFSPLLPATVFLVVLISCREQEPEVSGVEETYSPYHKIPNAKYVGAKECRECHDKEFAEWMESDHHKAMLVATEESVLGNFDNSEFEHFGMKTKFYRKGDEFWVNTEGPDGEMVDYKIDYTFGHYPLQQYLIAFPGGRYQALQVCWDSRPNEEGGQRWYHLYPDEPVPSGDILHWTRRHFNWNYMCADCHSTNLRKGFDSEKNEYNTTWSEINVSCEACHGPASVHVEWAREQGSESNSEASAGNSPDTKELAKYLKSKGLVVTLKEPEEGGWALNSETGQPERTRPLASNVQVDSCARCHAHRQLMAAKFKAGQPFFDTHVPSVLSDQLYHHDGQIDEEVYVYGSYVQSKMYHKGVRCTDCHNPHSMKLKLPGNALCLQCHDSSKYNATTHHFHQLDSTGASCVECHMPTKHYMVVDARRDHSLRVPRPDLAKKLGTPDACTNCHTDKDVDWAADAFETWWGKGPRNTHYGEILSAGRSGTPGGLDKLMALAADTDRPGIARATAIEAMANYHAPSQESLQVIANQLDDPDPAIRVEALKALLPVQPQQRLQIAAGKLSDPLRAVRTEAARVLAPTVSQMSEAQRTNFETAAAEFVAKQKAIADRAAGHMGLALFYADLGDFAKAESAYRDGIRIEPEFVPTRVNLAELLYQQNRLVDAETEFKGAVENAMVDENRGLAHDAYARFLVRQKRYDEALEQLKTATGLMPRHAQTHYFYGVALNTLGRLEEALPALERAVELDPLNVEYLVGTAAILRDAGKIEAALKYAKQARQSQPGQQIDSLIDQLQQLLLNR
ncbi:MAG: tetratricopeptide repeat protein [Verrucomicrobiales bacterium]|nr:tetratricopeptide repeat protein [Verrucomicrobiales bacterium]